MTRVYLSNDSISIKGHSCYAQRGDDIVCAAVSILAQTMAECLLRQGISTIDDMIIEAGDVRLKWTDRPECLDTIMTGFELLEANFPENVNIEKER